MKDIKFEIDRDLFRQVSKVAKMRGISFDDAVSQLIEEALESFDPELAGQHQQAPSANITRH